MSASRYNLIQDFTDSTEGNVEIGDVAVSPNWVMLVVRLGVPLSFDRAKNQSVPDGDKSNATKLRGPNLIIVNDCINLHVIGSKSVHTKNLQATLKQTDHNYLVEILPGDWVLAWMTNDPDTFNKLLTKIREGKVDKPCNEFMDGFKFLGRVQDVRKAMHRDPYSGIRTSTVSVTANGFRELDTSIFYDPSLNRSDLNNINDWLAQIDVQLSDFFTLSANGDLENNCRTIISTFLDILVGKGIGKTINISNQDVKGTDLKAPQSVTGGGSTQAAPYAYIVPAEVGKFLGIDASKKNHGILTYADILATMMGVQLFTSSSSDHDGSIFVPESAPQPGQDSPIRRFTSTELLGSFLPLNPPLTNTPIWSILQQFVNNAINEMYTSMGICSFKDTQGNVVNRIMPTLVLRQIPFTTEAFTVLEKANPDDPESTAVNDVTSNVIVTKFLSLPRWVLHPTLIHDLDLGRSDATRVNFVHVYGQNSVQDKEAQVPFSVQIALNPPARDDIDIQRNGLRIYQNTIPCLNQDQIGKTPSTWIALVADRLIGSQLTLNGTVSSYGIQAPISEGDNIQINKEVYHIEQITHICSQNPAGLRTFRTSFSLSNGMVAEPDNGNPQDSFGLAKFPSYPGVNPSDVTQFDPTTTVDDRYDRTDPSVDKGDLAVVDRQTGGVPVASNVVTKQPGEETISVDLDQFIGSDK